MGLIEDLRYLNAWKRLIEAVGIQWTPSRTSLQDGLLGKTDT